MAQLPNELSLRKGAEVVVTGKNDDGWYVGQCDGQTGIFPPAFVALLDDQETPPLDEIASQHPVYGNIQQPSGFQPQTIANNQQNAIINRPHGVALYDFHGQHNDELDLCEGETIYLLKHVNNEWIQGENAFGRLGILPTNFVRIVVDCQKQPEADLLLLDFDPPPSDGYSAATHNLYPIEANNTHHPSEIDWSSSSGRLTSSLENVIERNLIQLGTSSSSEACRKERPPSWTQTLSQMQVQILPEVLIPPRHDEPEPNLATGSVSFDDDPVREPESDEPPWQPAPVVSHHQQLPPVPPRQRETIPVRPTSQVEPDPPVILRNHQEKNSPELSSRSTIVNDNNNHHHKAALLDDRGAPPRRSLHRISRPAPPPPVGSPNTGRLSVAPQQRPKPARPMPSRSLSLDPNALSGKNSLGSSL